MTVQQNKVPLSMVERVARAVSATQTETPDMWKAFLPEARAAIDAMRGANGAMRSAGAEAARIHTSYFDNPTAQIVFTAMIDAALAEDPQK